MVSSRIGVRYITLELGRIIPRHPELVKSARCDIGHRTYVRLLMGNIGRATIRTIRIYGADSHEPHI